MNTQISNGVKQHSTKKLLLVIAVLLAVGTIAWLFSKRSPQTPATPPPDAGGAVGNISSGPPDREPTPQDAALIRGTITAVTKSDNAYRLTLALTGFGGGNIGTAEVVMTAEQAYDSDSIDISSAPEWISEHLKKRDLAKQPPHKNDSVVVLATLEALQNSNNTAGDGTFTFNQSAEKRVIFLPQ